MLDTIGTIGTIGRSYEGPLVFAGLFVYIGGMLILLLKALYISFLIVLFYLELAFTVTMAFLKVTFFGL